MAKETELEVIECERRDLEAIGVRLKELEDAAEDATRKVDSQAEVCARFATPEGLVSASDEEILAATKTMRSLQRAAAQAKLHVETYASGPAKDLTGRLRALERRRWDAEHAAARATLITALKAHLELANQTLASEYRLGELARAAGYAAPEPLLAPREIGQVAVLEISKRDLCAYDPDFAAIPRDDIQRRIWENSRYR
jgi:hypothetical protein